jgi:potassium channel subfamily K
MARGRERYITRVCHHRQLFSLWPDDGPHSLQHQRAHHHRLLIGLVAAAPAHLPLPTTELSTYSQAYYYACFAGAIYFILSTMLTVTAGGVWIFQFSRGYKLTLSQRSVMLQTTLFLSYLLAAGAVYSRIEGWNFVDAVYYVNVTLFTIGFGEFTPQTRLGRGLFFPMAAGGILFVGLIIASIRTLVLESGSRKISTRMVEKARNKAIKHGDPATGTFKLRGFQVRKVGDGPLTELERREQEFNIMREVQRQAAHDNRMIALAVSASSFFLLWFVGAVVFWQAEQAPGGGDWSYFESLYFTYVALLTIGYGDFYPQTNSAKPAFVLWSLIALPTLTVLIGAIGDAVSDFVASATLWLGNHILESTKALRQLKGTAKKKNREGAFEQAKPAGFMSDGAVEDGEYDDPAHAMAVQGLTQDGQPDTGDQEMKDRRNAAAAGESYWLYLVTKEIKNVVQHLDASPPRKYTFGEWTWFLKLISEKEDEEHGHRRHWHPEHLVNGPVREHQDQVWSWMGQESPLMSTEDEPKWVLLKLIEVVEREMKKKGDAKIDREQDKGTKEKLAIDGQSE